MLASYKVSDSLFLTGSGKGVSANKSDNGNVTQSRSCKSDFNFCLLNARSLKDKLNMVQEFRDDRKIDVMFFTECWLKDDDTAAIGQLENGGTSNSLTNLEIPDKVVESDVY